MVIMRTLAATVLTAASWAGAGETLVDFSDGLFPNGEGPLTYQGITFTNSGNGTGASGMWGTSDWGFYFANVPGASQGLAFNDGWGNSDLRLDFPEGTTRVELLVSTGPQTLFAADFYAAGDIYLYTVEQPMPGDGQAGAIVGEGGDRSIAYLRLYEPKGENGNITLIDDIRYTTGGDCYADFTGDGVLDLFDFLAYVNAFNAGDPVADCDEDGSLDLFDFLCFVNAFNAGC